MSRLLFGIDRLLAAPGLIGGRIGLVTNDAARTALKARMRSRVAMQRAGFGLVRLFSPEHGLQTKAADGVAVPDGFDSLTGLPVVSLYGECTRPAPGDLVDLDAVVFDIPDIGVRFYTYIWTLWDVLRACADARVPLIVLDRPNPLSGDLSSAEGPMLDVTRFGSFVGRAAIPIRHALTVGELARLWNAEVNLNTDLEVVQCSGWARAMQWPDTSLPFVRTSPAIASYEAALLYPGLCLFEATNLSVGRGTDSPFRVIGAPWLQAGETVREFNAQRLEGVRAVPCCFTPSQSPHSSTFCRGVQLDVEDARGIRPVSVGLHLLSAVIRLHRPCFQWAPYATAANPTGESHFERLIGQAGVREALEHSPDDLRQRVEEWTAVPDWPKRAAACLLYD